jgi:hypothetical protein
MSDLLFRLLLVPGFVAVGCVTWDTTSVCGVCLGAWCVCLFAMLWWGGCVVARWGRYVVCAHMCVACGYI